MDKPLIKICGLRSTDVAEQSVRAGAHWIGIVCHPGSKRFADLGQVKRIAAATKASGGIPVAVFVEHTVQQMMELCKTTGIQVVQLHGDIAREQHKLLPSYYRRIYVCPVANSGIRARDRIGLASCDSDRDYVLFDHIQAGSGQAFPWQALQYTGPLRTGIAGGLNSNNVVDAIKQFSPAFVDTSSGVERISGEKDLDLIRKFIHCVYQN